VDEVPRVGVVVVDHDHVRRGHPLNLVALLPIDLVGSHGWLP
jgi:hypothetical protein